MKNMDEIRWIAAFEFMKDPAIKSITVNFLGLDIEIDRNLNCFLA